MALNILFALSLYVSHCGCNVCLYYLIHNRAPDDVYVSIKHIHFLLCVLFLLVLLWLLLFSVGWQYLPMLTVNRGIARKIKEENLIQYGLISWADSNF